LVEEEYTKQYFYRPRKGMLFGSRSEPKDKSCYGQGLYTVTKGWNLARKLEDLQPINTDVLENFFKSMETDPTVTKDTYQAAWGYESTLSGYIEKLVTVVKYVNMYKRSLNSDEEYCSRLKAALRNKTASGAVKFSDIDDQLLQDNTAYKNLLAAGFGVDEQGNPEFLSRDSSSPSGIGFREEYIGGRRNTRKSKARRSQKSRKSKKSSQRKTRRN
jgi:hypothetical protein